MPLKVLTDYKNLKYFITTKKLMPRQAKWAEFLSEVNFVITYQSWKKNDKAKTLTKRPNKQLINNKNKRQKHKMQVLLPLEQIEIQSIKVTNESEEEKAEKSWLNRMPQSCMQSFNLLKEVLKLKIRKKNLPTYLLYPTKLKKQIKTMSYSQKSRNM